MSYFVRVATAADIDTCQRIARSHSKWLPFVRRDSLLRAIDCHELFVADSDGAVVGFVNWHGRRDGWSTVYDLAVSRGYEGQGIGRALLYAVMCPIRLKCTADNPANMFYRNAGMSLATTEIARSGRALNVYEMRILSILCAGNNRRFPEVARQSQMAYGARQDYQIRAWPFMIDISWKSYDWAKYMATINEYHPVMAMVADYEHPDQRDLMLAQVADLRAAGILRIMVCPKFDGAVADIPLDCVVAISVPSKYAGFVPDMREVKGRRTHLLGGSPVSQRAIISQLSGAGATVISADGNSHTKTASQGGYWRDNKWNFDREAFDYYDLCKLSGREIVKTVNAAAGWSQLPLFAGVA